MPAGSAISTRAGTTCWFRHAGYSLPAAFSKEARNLALYILGTALLAGLWGICLRHRANRLELVIAV
jgi:hypothetical protein